MREQERERERGREREIMEISKAFCLDVAQGHMKGAPNETQTVRLLVELANHYTTRGDLIYEALCFDVALGQMNGAPNETRTHSCRFTSLAC